MLSEHDRKLLEKEGWEIECESPLEIRDKDGNFARDFGAVCVITVLNDEAEDEHTTYIEVTDAVASRLTEIAAGLLPNHDLVLRCRKRNLPTIPGCKHSSVHWRISPYEPHIGPSIEVCNFCGMSRSHWEQGQSEWVRVDVSDFPLAK